MEDEVKEFLMGRGLSEREGMVLSKVERLGGKMLYRSD